MINHIIASTKNHVNLESEPRDPSGPSKRQRMDIDLTKSNAFWTDDVIYFDDSRSGQDMEEGELLEDGRNKSNSLRKRILVCAPSNVAVDEIARRLILEGLHKIVRIGMPESIHSDVNPVSMVSLH